CPINYRQALQESPQKSPDAIREAAYEAEQENEALWKCPHFVYGTPRRASIREAAKRSMEDLEELQRSAAHFTNLRIMKRDSGPMASRLVTTWPGWVLQEFRTQTWLQGGSPALLYRATSRASLY
ncbi:hypothetical protein AMECASPLE_023958, partial [Ameca splendens]